jgi:hypothetical protein
MVFAIEPENEINIKIKHYPNLPKPYTISFSGKEYHNIDIQGELKDVMNDLWVVLNAIEIMRKNNKDE